MNIQPIVEGHGDVKALPVLLRRFRDEAEVRDVDVGRPIRRPRSRLVDAAGVQQAVRLLFSLPAAYRRSRSFRKLADSFGNLVRAMGREVGVWPPATWTGVA